MPLSEPGPNLTNAIAWPEPGPHWTEAKRTWGLAWEFHIYSFGGIWTLAAAYFLVFLAQSVSSWKNGQKRGPFIMLSLQLFIQALSRSLVLFLNPYGSRSTSQVTLVTGITAWSLGTAGLTSAFGVLLLILLDATKLSIAPPKFQNLVVLIVITLFNFLFILVSDIVVAYYQSAKALLLVCQLLFALWGIVISVGYFMVGNRTRRNLRATFQNLAPQTYKEPSQKRDFARLRGLIIKCYASSFVGLCIFGLNIYAMFFGDSSVLSGKKYVDSWTWWGFETTLRLLELLMCLLIVVVALGTTRTTN